jgi:hypothetical protein
MKEVNSGLSLGDKIKDKTHLLQHLKENYIFGSIIFNAVREAGYKIPAFIIETSKEAVKQSLYKYLIKKLIIA